MYKLLISDETARKNTTRVKSILGSIFMNYYGRDVMGFCFVLPFPMKYIHDCLLTQYNYQLKKSDNPRVKHHYQ